MHISIEISFCTKTEIFCTNMHKTVIWFDGTLFWSASILQIFILVFFSLNITDVPVWCFYKCGWFISNWNAQIRPDEQYCCCRIERKSSYLLLKLIPKTSISWKLNFFKISNSSLKKISCLKISNMDCAEWCYVGVFNFITW